MASLRYYPENGLSISESKIIEMLYDKFEEWQIENFIHKIIKRHYDPQMFADMVVHKLMPTVAKYYKDMDSDNAERVKEFSEWFKTIKY